MFQPNASCKKMSPAYRSTWRMGKARASWFGIPVLKPKDLFYHAGISYIQVCCRTIRIQHKDNFTFSCHYSEFQGSKVGPILGWLTPFGWETHHIKYILYNQSHLNLTCLPLPPPGVFEIQIHPWKKRNAPSKSERIWRNATNCHWWHSPGSNLLHVHAKRCTLWLELVMAAPSFSSNFLLIELSTYV